MNLVNQELIKQIFVQFFKNILIKCFAFVAWTFFPGFCKSVWTDLANKKEPEIKRRNIEISSFKETSMVWL